MKKSRFVEPMWAILLKALGEITLTAVVIMLVWIAISWVNVILNNCDSNGSIWSYNLFALLF